MIIFSLAVGYTLESTPESRTKLQVQCAHDEEVAGKVKRGGNGVIGAETATLVTYQPHGIAPQQQSGAGETGQRGVGRAGKP